MSCCGCAVSGVYDVVLEYMRSDEAEVAVLDNLYEAVVLYDCVVRQLRERGDFSGVFWELARLYEGSKSCAKGVGLLQFNEVVRGDERLFNGIAAEEVCY